MKITRQITFYFHQTHNPLIVSSTKWSNTLRKFVDSQPTNCSSEFDHFGGLALKGLTIILRGNFSRKRLTCLKCQNCPDTSWNLGILSVVAVYLAWIRHDYYLCRKTCFLIYHSKVNISKSWTGFYMIGTSVMTELISNH